MTIEIKVPDIGTDEVEVTEILVNIGDKIDTNQLLITVEGNKASIEIPAPCSGIIKDIKINIGDKVSTGTIIMLFDEEVLSKSFSNTKVTLDNNYVDNTQNEIDVDTTILNTKAVSDNNYVDNTQNEAYVYATPVIRSLAREFGINLAHIKGTGRKGRILREDIQKYIKNIIKSVKTIDNKSVPILSVFPKINYHQFGEIEEIELGRIQKISGANLHRNWTMIPHVTQFDEANITEVEEFRKLQNAEAKINNLDFKLTLLSFVMKSVAKALTELPLINSSLSEDGQTLILKKYIHIGIAVDTINGLVVPVCRDVNKKGIIELSRELMILSQKAHAGQLTSSDIEGGSFTISSLGGIGGMQFTPIVNAPEVAILGISKSYLKPIWTGKSFIPILMLPLSLSYDHRVINGGDGVRFISLVSKFISNIRYLVM